jgi:hypothetical protein
LELRRVGDLALKRQHDGIWHRAKYGVFDDHHHPAVGFHSWCYGVFMLDGTISVVPYNNKLASCGLCTYYRIREAA